MVYYRVLIAREEEISQFLAGSKGLLEKNFFMWYFRQGQRMMYEITRVFK